MADPYADLDRALREPPRKLHGTDPLGWLLDDPVVADATRQFEPDNSAPARAAALQAADRLDPRSSRWSRDPAGWARERLGVSLYSKQESILESVRDNHNTAVHTSHTIGKSFTASVAAAWWIDTHPVGQAFVVTTAPSSAQVRAILWREIGRLHLKSKDTPYGQLPGRINLTSEWYIGNELVAFGRKPPDYTDDTFQGIHALYVLLILDEACGIPRMLWDAGSTLVSNDGSRQLALGNPDDPDTVFGEVCGARASSSAREEFNVIHVSSFDTPNFTGEKVTHEIAASLVSVRWVEERKKIWGERSSIYQSKVLGKFPVDADDGVIPYSWVVGCRHLELPNDTPVTAGLDVAGTGADRTVLRVRRGARIAEEFVWHDSSDPEVLVTDVCIRLRECEVDRVVIDAEGVGFGIMGEIKRRSFKHNPTGGQERVHNAEVVAYRAASRPRDREHLNTRAEVHWRFRELARLKMVDLTDLDDDAIAELTAPRYEIVTGSGKIKIESKDDLKKRLGLSPDRAEAILLACWDTHTGAGIVASPRVLAAPYPSASPMRQVTADDLGIAGPRWGRPEVTEPTEEDRREQQLMLELMRGR